MAIHFQKVSYTYQAGTPFEGRALFDVTLDIEDGSYTAFIGHTGSGKSTIMQLLNGLLIPTSGEVIVDGQSITNQSKNKDIKSIRKTVGLVFQFPESQLFEETVLKDVAFGPQNFGVSKEKAEKIAREKLNLVGIAEELFEKNPFELSGGQMRRVAIAGILAMEPKVLVLDEPTAGLDKLYQRRQNNQSFVLPSKTHDTTPNYQIDSSEDVTPIPEISSSQIKIEEKQELESLVVNDRDKREISRLSRYQLEEKKSKSILSVLLLSLLALAVFTFIFFAVWKQFSTEHKIDNITSIFTKKSSDASKAKDTVPTETTQTSSSEKQTIITSQGQDNYLNATVTKAKDTVEVTVTLTDAESLWFSLTNSDIGEAGMTLTKENPTYTTTLSADVAESIITLGMPHGVEIKIDNQPLDLTPLTSSDISYITLSIQQ